MSQATPPVCGPLGTFFPPEHAAVWTPAPATTASRDLEEAIVTGLGFFRLIRDANQRWSDAIDAGKAEFSWAVAEQFAAAFRWWLGGARPLIEAVAAREKQGLEVDRAEEFRAAFLEVSLLPLDTARARASAAATEKGPGVPLEEAMDDLQAHLHQ